MSEPFIPTDFEALTFRELQKQVGDWSQRNFPSNTADEPFLGLVEEAGELSHSILKARQGIRGTREEHEAKERDAVGDVMIYLADWFRRAGFDMGRAVNEVYYDGLDVSDADAEHLSLLGLEGMMAQDRERASRVLTPAGAFRQLVTDIGDLSCAIGSEDVGCFVQCGGQIVLSLASYCLARGFSFAQIVAETWDHVRKRDWTKNATTGQVA